MSLPGQEDSNSGISENPQAMMYLFGLFIQLLGVEQCRSFICLEPRLEGLGALSEPRGQC